jgi:hypothetical protein
MMLSYLADQTFEIRVQTTLGAISLASDRVPPGQWQHVIAVVRLQPEELHLYLDGRPVDGSPMALRAHLAPIELHPTRTQAKYFAKYRIGVNSPIYDYQRHFFRGLIDDVQIYDRALSTHEIELLSLPRVQK